MILGLLWKYYWENSLTTYITNVIWTNEACNILYESARHWCMQFLVTWRQVCLHFLRLLLRSYTDGSLINKIFELFSYYSFNVHSLFLFFSPSN